MPETIQSPSLTADWEEKLSRMEHGDYDPRLFMQEIDEMVSMLVQTYHAAEGAEYLMPRKNAVGKCPHCGAQVIENAKAWSCVNRDMKLTDVTTHVLDKYYKELRNVKAVCVNHKGVEYVTNHMVHEIHKVLRSAFNQAIKWELVSKNPAEHVTLPKEVHEKREIWDAETLFKAMDLCEDETLLLALNLAFACSLRMGEMLALTWDCIDITEEAIEAGKAYIFVNKELQRVSKDSMQALDEKGIIFKFPPMVKGNNTALVLKEPKTITSTRKVFLPKTVAEMLIKRKAEQEELKDLFGDEYSDYNLVFANTIGHPIEGQIINRALHHLIEENDLPPVVFHSLRHSSITYKLKLNGGDMKAVQGDSGHAQVKMVADVYSHILDEDRRLNAQRFEEEFYSRKQDEEKKAEEAVPEQEVEKEVAPSEEKTGMTDQEMLLKLLQNPEMASLIKTLAKTL